MAGSQAGCIKEQTHRYLGREWGPVRGPLQGTRVQALAEDIGSFSPKPLWHCGAAEAPAHPINLGVAGGAPRNGAQHGASGCPLEHPWHLRGCGEPDPGREHSGPTFSPDAYASFTPSSARLSPDRSRLLDQRSSTLLADFVSPHMSKALALSLCPTAFPRFAFVSLNKDPGDEISVSG